MKVFTGNQKKPTHSPLHVNGAHSVRDALLSLQKGNLTSFSVCFFVVVVVFICPKMDMN